MECVIGLRLRDIRVSKGLKQKDVADMLNCAATTVTNWEKGTIKPPLDMLSRLCEALEISALDLLGRRYKYSDILKISQTPVHLRSYEQQVVLNFSGAILAKAEDKELARLDKQRENERYISNTTGLIPDAVDALIDYDDRDFDGEAENKVSPIAREALNKLLTCPKGLQALENIAKYLRSGDYRFSDGSKMVKVDIGSFNGKDATEIASISFSPDMVGHIARGEFIRLIDSLKAQLPPEEVDSAKEQFRADMKKQRKVAE